jgi:predicted metal-dependent hydrolase
MSIRTKKIRVSDFTVNIIRKEIKNIHLSVYPPQGNVRVSVPSDTTNEKIRLLVISKLAWIRTQQKKFLTQQRQEKRKFVSGETHYLFGTKFRLKVINFTSKPKIIKKNDILEMYISKRSSIKMRNQLFEKFYRNELEKILPTFVEKWSKKVMATPNEVRIRKMKTRWGTCNSDDKRIWLNLELAKKPKICISYVVLHEVIHLIEKKHSEKFIGILGSLMPNWNAIRDELNVYPLSHTNWNCSVR